MKSILICNPENRRAEFFRAACKRLSIPEPTEISWLDWLDGKNEFDPADTDFIRVESPGENFAVEQKLIALGGGPDLFEPDHGRLRFQPEWYRGWQKTLVQLSKICGPKSSVMNPPEAIMLMFHKLRAQEHLDRHDVPTPLRLGPIESFEHLIAQMDETQINRVFIKPYHSSSASGIIALQRSSKGQLLATTPCEWIPEQSAIYNSLRLRHYRNPDLISGLIDTLANQHIFAERWFPKATFEGKAFDLRVLVIDGMAKHAVARSSASPITNLHLGNQRGDLQTIRESIDESIWQTGLQVCEQAAAAFPDNHYVAVDLMISSQRNKFAVAEVNAFGDLIPNLLCDGDDTYTAELRSYLAKRSR